MAHWDKVLTPYTISPAPYGFTVHLKEPNNPRIYQIPCTLPYQNIENNRTNKIYIEPNNHIVFLHHKRKFLVVLHNHEDDSGMEDPIHSDRPDPKIVKFFEEKGYLMPDCLNNFEFISQCPMRKFCRLKPYFKLSNLAPVFHDNPRTIYRVIHGFNVDIDTIERSMLYSDAEWCDLLRWGIVNYFRKDSNAGLTDPIVRL